MLRTVRVLTLAAAFLASGEALAVDFPFDSFSRTTLGAIVAAWSDEDPPPPGQDASVINGPIERDVVRAIYRGQHRPVDARTAAFIASYEKDHHLTQNLAALYQDEYLFSSEGVDYWLPVQAPVTEFFGRELKPGAAIDLYLINAGGLTYDGAWRWILTVEEFQSVGDAPV